MLVLSIFVQVSIKCYFGFFFQVTSMTHLLLTIVIVSVVFSYLCHKCWSELAWGHLISWYKQMYDVLLSIVGNYIANSLNLVYSFGAKVL